MAVGAAGRGAPGLTRLRACTCQTGYRHLLPLLPRLVPAAPPPCLLLELGRLSAGAGGRMSREGVPQVGRSSEAWVWDHEASL